MTERNAGAAFDDMGPEDLRAWLDLRRTRLAEHTVHLRALLLEGRGH
jgi:hypothetical protein